METKCGNPELSSAQQRDEAVRNKGWQQRLAFAFTHLITASPTDLVGAVFNEIDER